MKKIVKALGDQCPLPVVKATKALDALKEGGTLEIHVDNPIAVQNLLRMAEGHNLKSKETKVKAKKYVVTIEVPPLAVRKAMAQGEGGPCTVDPSEILAGIQEESKINKGQVVAIASEFLGHGSPDLGKALMKGFIFALSQLAKLPETIIFYNGGAKHTTSGSASLEDLRKMQAEGVRILTCGTCLNFFDLTEKLAVGEVTNMYTIVEILTSAKGVIKQ